MQMKSSVQQNFELESFISSIIAKVVSFCLLIFNFAQAFPLQFYHNEMLAKLQASNHYTISFLSQCVSRIILSIRIGSAVDSFIDVRIKTDYLDGLPRFVYNNHNSYKSIDILLCLFLVFLSFSSLDVLKCSWNLTLY